MTSSHKFLPVLQFQTWVPSWGALNPIRRCCLHSHQFAIIVPADTSCLAWSCNEIHKPNRTIGNNSPSAVWAPQFWPNVLHVLQYICFHLIQPCNQHQWKLPFWFLGSKGFCWLATCRDITCPWLCGIFFQQPYSFWGWFSNHAMSFLYCCCTVLPDVSPRHLMASTMAYM